MVNVPLIEDTLAMRVGGNFVRRDGYTRDTFSNRDTRDVEREGGRLKLLWNATENLEVQWTSSFQSSASELDLGLVLYGNDNITQGLAVSGEPWQVLADELGQTLPLLSLQRSASLTAMTSQRQFSAH